MRPYYESAGIAVYHGRMEDVIPTLDLSGVDCAICDPPYGETSLTWDRWPAGWPGVLEAAGIRQLWCFGSMRMFLERSGEFDRWRFAQDIVWEKQNGSGFHGDRFRRIHEAACHFYRGSWGDLFHEAPRTMDAIGKRVHRRTKPAHWSRIGEASYASEDGRPRLMVSVIRARNCHGHAVNETEKPEAIIEPLLAYSVPSGGLVLDVFSGSGTVAAVAKRTGRRCISIESREEQCQLAALRLQRPWSGEAPAAPGQAKLWGLP